MQVTRVEVWWNSDWKNINDIADDWKKNDDNVSDWKNTEDNWKNVEDDWKNIYNINDDDAHSNWVHCSLDWIIVLCSLLQHGISLQVSVQYESNMIHGIAL